MTSKIDPGIHPDIPMIDYINDPCPEPSVSKGIVQLLIERSPIHAWHGHPRLGGRKDDGSTEADMGSAAHAILFGGTDRIVFGDSSWLDWRKKEARKFRDQTRAEGKIPVLSRQHDALRGMLEPAKKALSVFGAGKAEHTMIWQDNDVWCRSRPDFMTDDLDIVIDYKTTSNADPQTWARWAMTQSGYDIQAAMCMRALDRLVCERQRQFMFMLQETELPFEVSFVVVSPELEEFALRKITRALKIWRKCLDSNEWPGYERKPYYADIPSFAMWDLEAREIRGGIK